MKAEEFDRKFDANEEDILADLDLARMERPGHTPQRVNVDFPSWMVEALDREASRLGISRESVIKAWIAKHLESSASR